MKKAAVVAVVLVVLIAFAGATSFWLGMRARQAYGTLLQQIGKDAGFAVTNLRFESGWVSSTAEAALTLPGIPGDVSVVSRIRPGPFPEITHFGFMPGMAVVSTKLSVISPDLANLPPITARTMIYLAGNSTTRLHIPAYKRMDRHGTGFSWAAATGKIIAAADQKAIKGNIDFSQAQLSGAEGPVTLSQVAFNWTPQAGAADADESSLSIGHISGPGLASRAGIEGLRITLLKQYRAGDVAAQITVQLHTVDDGISSYGPGQLLVQISKLDGASLTRFQQGTQTLARRHLPADRMSTEMFTQATGLVRALARKAPQLKIARFGLKVGSSEIAGKGKFVLDGADIGGSGYPELLQRAVNGSMELMVPRAVVANFATDEIHGRLDTYKTQGTLTPEEVSRLTPQRVARIVRSALPAYMKQIASRWHLVPAGADYVLSVAIHHGQLLIDGQPGGTGQPAR
ncbi:MAG: DUF945 family protein [Acidiferrobacterales bacterium]